MTDAVRLTRDLGMPIGEPRWPSGISLVPFSATLAPKAHALLMLAYRDGGGLVPEAFDDWWAATRHDPEFDAALCLCAIDGTGELVGVAMCWTTAFVKDVVVHPAHRNQGIGEALLRSALAALSRRGHGEVALKVQPDNMPARRLYARVGFRKD
jgi:ribosomal protein S18 acetylase RimI-like enzyme